MCGVMADLVPPADIARITALLGAPYANTFGATETGRPPCSSTLDPGRRRAEHAERAETEPVLRGAPGWAPTTTTFRWGSPGELAMRGPTLFSGYWKNAAANAHDFRGGWFHMGDAFVPGTRMARSISSIA
ncbi:MAG: hypothetical protein V9G22_15870 [Ottowia sp.]